MFRVRCFLLSVVSLSFAISLSAHAVSVNVLGLDDMSCKDWVESKQDVEQRSYFVSWVRGFLTGHNYARQSQQVSVVSSGTIEVFVNRYCVENPLGTLDAAASRMSDKFSGRNQPIRK